jgi:hypothetical protein
MLTAIVNGLGVLGTVAGNTKRLGVVNSMRSPASKGYHMIKSQLHISSPATEALMSVLVKECSPLSVGDSAGGGLDSRPSNTFPFLLESRIQRVILPLVFLDVFLTLYVFGVAPGSLLFDVLGIVITPPVWVSLFVGGALFLQFVGIGRPVCLRLFLPSLSVGGVIALSLRSFLVRMKGGPNLANCKSMLPVLLIPFLGNQGSTGFASRRQPIFTRLGFVKLAQRFLGMALGTRFIHASIIPQMPSLREWGNA